MGNSKLPKDLLAVLAALDEPRAIARLADDLLSPAEIHSLAERWAIVKRLASGETQRGVRDAVGVSLATVSRGSRQLKFGSGGFALAFDTLAKLGKSDPRGETGSR